jgi:NAD(P)-dependent dehydrogenase (short-subunit alcohol dehydrogenase family)
MDAELRGKTAVVTGASKGIGYEVAAALAKAGANVVLCARHAEEVARASRELDELGEGRVIGVSCDMRQYDEVRRLIGRAVEEFDGVDILINNAGVGVFAAIDELSVDDWHSMIETNLNGVFYASHSAIPHMKRRGGGWIINIASLAGKNPFAGGAAYNASKFGLVGFSEAMMLDVRHHGIRVSYIMPGSVATYFNDHTPGDADAWKIQPQDVAQIVMDLLAMPERTLPSRVEVRPSRPPQK